MALPTTSPHSAATFELADYTDICMIRITMPPPKRLLWIASSRRDMRALPPAVKRIFGVALFVAQSGEMPPAAKPLKGFGGAGVLELMEDDRSGTYRAVYTVRYATAIYVLHVFQKKSKQGGETPRREIEIIRKRLKRAEEIHAAAGKEREQ